MGSAKRFVKVSENKIYDQSFIFAHVSELILSNREIRMEDCLATELAVYPPAYFDEEGHMRAGTKSKLMSSLAVKVPMRNIKCVLHIYDVSALLRSITWPKEGCFLTSYSKAFQVLVLGALAHGDVILVFDRYF